MSAYDEIAYETHSTERLFFRAPNVEDESDIKALIRLNNDPSMKSFFIGPTANPVGKAKILEDEKAPSRFFSPVVCLRSTKEVVGRVSLNSPWTATQSANDLQTGDIWLAIRILCKLSSFPVLP